MYGGGVTGLKLVGPLGVTGTMSKLTTMMKTAGATGIALLALSGAALADGYGGSVKDAPADEGRKFGWSITLGGTSDYIFRGISLTDEDPAAQGSIDITYGIAYAGIWASNISGLSNPIEIDYYAGIKPVLGPVTFDFGVLYYTYPNGDDDANGHELDYVELKAGASVSPVKNLTIGVVGYYSPEQAGFGDTYAVEGSAGYTLPTVGIFTPTIGGVLGWQGSENNDVFVTNGDEYVYWNAGLALAVEKFTFDFRYWDTDISESDSLYGKLADERFVFSAKVTLP
jgi:uncharacterized protein (TIGR02001 family)